jgi:hypothetical protein
MPREFRAILNVIARMNKHIHRHDKPQRAGVKQPAGGSGPPGGDAPSIPASDQGVSPNSASEAPSNN